MEDPCFLRSQAAFCENLAARISNIQTAERLRSAASRYVDRAIELEAGLSTADAVPFTTE
jgi:hypothetical protein